MKTILSFRAVAVAAILCHGQAAWAGEATPFKLKNHSTFTAPESVHNPFWPIGWAKSTALPTANNVVENNAPSVPQVQLRPEDFAVTSISMNQPAIAIINGKLYSEGQLFVVNVGGGKLSVRVQSIQDGNVVLRYGGGDVNCLLRRKEAIPHPVSSVPQETATIDNSLTLPR